MKTSEVLKQTLKKLDGGKAWTQFAAARDAEGSCMSDANAANAVCFCLSGALGVIMRGRPYGLAKAERALDSALPPAFRNYIQYNDSPRCEFSHVRALVFKAIRMSEDMEAHS